MFHRSWMRPLEINGNRTQIVSARLYLPVQENDRYVAALSSTNHSCEKLLVMISTLLTRLSMSDWI
jgi:hypothetical protein